MTSSMKIGGGRGVCVSCIFTAAVESIALSASSIANLLSVVIWLTGGLVCLLLTLVLLASSLRFFV